MKKNPESLVEKARALATTGHAGQFRLDGKTPYITHPASVVKLLQDLEVKDEDTLAAAWLHDTMEDCGITKEQIATATNAHVAEMVFTLTRNIERDDYKARLKKAERAVQLIKLADTVHNCSQLSDTVPEKTIRRKVEDTKSFYLSLAEKICPPFATLLLKYLKPWWDKY